MSSDNYREIHFDGQHWIVREGFASDDADVRAKEIGRYGSYLEAEAAAIDGIVEYGVSSTRAAVEELERWWPRNRERALRASHAELVEALVEQETAKNARDGAKSTCASGSMYAMCMKCEHCLAFFRVEAADKLVAAALARARALTEEDEDES